MKRSFIILGLLVIACQAFCDTIAYWHVYYNEKVIARFNEASEDLALKLSPNKIKKEDKISIRYGDDTPCWKCRSFLLVRDEKNRRLAIAETKEHWGKLSFSLSDLTAIGRKNQSKRLDFFYYEQGTNNKRGPEKLVLQLTFK